MKKFLFVLGLLFTSIASVAANPRLDLAKAFDGRYNKNKEVSIYEVRQPENYYCSIEVKDNPKIVKTLLTWFDQAERLASNMSSSSKEGVTRKILIVDGESSINIGANYPNDKTSIKIFLQSASPFLK